MNNNSVGIFDSGVGGLSILSEIQNLLPQETMIYIADKAYMPYGVKEKSQIIERCEKIIHFFIEREVKTVVIACNTATIAAVEELREKFDLPIIGTVPVVKRIANETKTGSIAVFATPATCKSAYLEDLIIKFAPQKKVFKVGESHLEDLIEKGDLDSSKIEHILREQLEPLLKENVDAIALGCTHYPFVKDKVEKIVGPNVGVFDSGGAIARRVREVLTNESMLSSQKGKDLYYTTGDEGEFSQVATVLLKKQVNADHVEI